MPSAPAIMPAPEVLDLCDRMGIFVWDEAFDKWNATGDNLNGPAGVLPNAQRQLAAMVQRDRNHPSIFRLVGGKRDRHVRWTNAATACPSGGWRRCARPC